MMLLKQLQNNRLTTAWLKIGLLSLSLAGVYVIVLVIVRISLLPNSFLTSQLFRSILIIYTNLSILFCLLSIVASIWSYNLKDNFYNKTYYKLAFIALILVASSPIFEQNPVMNNYIPMLENILFILGLSLFGVVMLLMAITSLLSFLPSPLLCPGSLMSFLRRRESSNLKNLLNSAIISSATMFILTWLCFVISYIQLQDIINIIPIDIDFYYELLFWSGGHLLQFVYIQILLTIWISLFKSCLNRRLKFQKLFNLVFWLNFIFSILTIGGHLCYNISDGGFKEYYIWHMKYFIAISPIGCLILMGLEGITQALCKKN